MKEPPVDIDLVDKLGDPDVRELIVADTPPPEDQPTPPPEDTPPPDDTPPPTDDPDMADPEQTPPPETPKPKTAPPRPKTGTPAPANAKHGPVAQEGVVGGNPNGTKATGTPGGLKVGGNWHQPKPPYPSQARMSHVQGTTTVRVTTDASGSVSSVVIVKSAGSAILDSSTQGYVKMNWKGPPNQTHETSFDYRLQ